MYVCMYYVNMILEQHMNACMYVCMYVYMFVHVRHLCVYVYVVYIRYVCTCLYVCMISHTSGYVYVCVVCVCLTWQHDHLVAEVDQVVEQIEYQRRRDHRIVVHLN